MIPAVIELRQYTLHPGRRDDLVTLFEREFVETQEAEGIHLIGQFLDLDDPDRFVWLRGFPDMECRRGSLERFYSGPAWAAHRDAANTTMIDSDDVLLLAPATPASGFADVARASPRPSDAVLLVGVHTLSAPDEDGAAATFEAEVRHALTAAGLRPLAVLATESAENTFPRLPVRTDGPVVVWFGAASDRSAAETALTGLDFEGRLGPRLQVLRLAPTPRSRLRP